MEGMKPVKVCSCADRVQADMITELYGQVLEQNRWDLVERFEEVFYCAD